MTFNYSNITVNDSIKIGSDTAPLKIVEYINLRCPDSKNYEENIAPFLEASIKEGKIQRIIKHFDKAKYGLESGNLLNQYLNHDTPTETYGLMQTIFKEQSAWGQNRIAQIPHVAAEYGLTIQAANSEISKRVLKEVQAVHVESIPTVFVGDEAFVETVDFDAFKTAVEGHL